MGARLVTVRLAERERCAPEGCTSGRRRSLQRSLPQQPDQSMSGRSLRYGRGRSRPSRRIPDVEKLDDRLQHERGLVRALCQPENHCRTMGRDRARSRGQDTRQRGFPPALNQRHRTRAARRAQWDDTGEVTHCVRTSLEFSPVERSIHFESHIDLGVALRCRMCFRPRSQFEPDDRPQRLIPSSPLGASPCIFALQEGAIGAG